MTRGPDREVAPKGPDREVAPRGPDGSPQNSLKVNIFGMKNVHGWKKRIFKWLAINRAEESPDAQLVQRLWRRKASLVHPDRCPKTFERNSEAVEWLKRLGKEIPENQEQCDEIIKALNNAHDELIDGNVITKVGCALQTVRKMWLHCKFSRVEPPHRRQIFVLVVIFVVGERLGIFVVVFVLVGPQQRTA